MKFSVVFILIITMVSCQSEKIELIPFPAEFYEKCFIDSSKNFFMIIGGDDLYNKQKRNQIDSLVLNAVQGRDFTVVTLYKEGADIDRNDFGQNYEPFGSEWESYLGDYRYAVYRISENKIKKMKLYDNRKLIELNWKEIK